ncbi:MAG: hypothetical protein LBM98_10750 [Oscillospiraceae bacterium]|nr:hypothetical protein [Oscillospiraceae bacterium]
MRYVELKPARQSSAGGVTYGICGLYYWIASRLNLDYMLSSPALAMTNSLVFYVLNLEAK